MSEKAFCDNAYLLEALSTRFSQHVVNGVTGNDNHGTEGEAEPETLRPDWIVTACGGLDGFVHDDTEEEQYLKKG